MGSQTPFFHNCASQRFEIMLSRITGARSMLRAVNRRTFSSGLGTMSGPAPMTRFIQYPFDKTKMEEVKWWVKENKLAEKAREIPGVKDVEISFCPGEGWLAGRYIFNSLEDLKALNSNETFQQFSEEAKKHEFYDNTREPHEFKGFYLHDV